MIKREGGRKILETNCCLTFFVRSFEAGLAPPTADECVRKDDWDEEEEEEEDELECDTQEEDESRGEVFERVEGRTSRNDSAIHRTPSPSSICHSLEWDSDDFIGHSQNQSLHHYGRLLYPS